MGENLKINFQLNFHPKWEQTIRNVIKNLVTQWELPNTGYN
jgi:hypothetical protein